jgi:hypothetical protein
MPKYVIEREVPGASKMTPEELQNIAATSNRALAEMDAPYHWLQTFVTGDKLYCIHIAPDEATVREHAQRGGFPVTRIEEVRAIIDPTTADG